MRLTLSINHNLKRTTYRRAVRHANSTASVNKLLNSLRNKGCMLKSRLMIPCTYCRRKSQKGQAISSTNNINSKLGGLEVCWLVPPLYLVSHALCLCNAQGTLIVPFWKSAPFWPLLCLDGRHWLALSVLINCPYVVGMLLPGYSRSNLGDSLNSESAL